MPVKAENRARYPSNWDEIAYAIKERASWRCEGSPDFPDCRVRHSAIGYRNDQKKWVELCIGDRQALAHRQHDYGDLFKLIRIVLTVCHLDHTPENCEPDNLKAWCQRCHLHYDRHHHNQTAAATRKAGKAAGDLFGATP